MNPEAIYLTPPLRENPARRTTISRDLVILCLACSGLLLPFAGKPVHVDDPLFIWTARQISSHPLDFYGFDLNWNGHREAMASVFINPPLVPYYLAAVARIAGWSEFRLHVSLLPFSLMSVIGLYFLARNFCRFPLWAALLMLLCPAFLVSSTTLMCEVLMQCLWIWATVLWIRGSKQSIFWLPTAGVLALLAVLTKYYAICLLPLFIGHALLFRKDGRRAAWQAISLSIPLAGILIYNHLTKQHYGHALFAQAIGFSTQFTARHSASNPARLLDALLFAGIGALGAVTIGFAAAGGRSKLLILGTIPLCTLAAHLLFQAPGGWASPWPFDIQAGLFAAAGVTILCVGIGDAFFSTDRRASLFLLLWTGGVFIFAARLNWSINARSVLPLVPPVCILTQRAIERSRQRGVMPYVLASSFAMAVCLLAMVADHQYADANRWAAEQLTRNRPAGTVWFTGHWGFQYYMQLHGAWPLDDENPQCRIGDSVIVPLNNYGDPPRRIRLKAIDSLNVATFPFLSLLDGPLGADYYFSPGDRLPMVFGSIPPQGFVVFRVTGIRLPAK